MGPVQQGTWVPWSRAVMEAWHLVLTRRGEKIPVFQKSEILPMKLNLHVQVSSIGSQS